MSESPTGKLLVSLFQIPEDYRAQLEKFALTTKVSINTCILNALDDYLNLPQNQQPKPALPKVPLRAFTIRTTSPMKQSITQCAAMWQLKSSFPTSMNAVVNTAILTYLQKNIQGYQPPF